MEQHRWMVDSIEEFIASVEVDGREIIERDESATAAARRASAEQVA